MRITFILLILFLPFNLWATEINIEQFRKYLDNMQSVVVDFEQTDSRSAKAKGKLLISKPYKFRCNYYAPFPLLIIGNEDYLSIYDYDMETVTRIKSSENIFNFLLVDVENFGEYFITEKVEDIGKIINLSLRHIESGKKSVISFDHDLKQISEIKIFESDNIITLKFARLQQISKFDNDLFILKDPKIFGVPKRLSAKNLQIKYLVKHPLTY